MTLAALTKRLRFRVQSVIDLVRCWYYCEFGPKLRYPMRAELVAKHGWQHVEGEYFMHRKHCDDCGVDDTIAAHAVDKAAGQNAIFRPQRRPFWGWRPTDVMPVKNSHGLVEYHNFHPEMAGDAWTLN